MKNKQFINLFIFLLAFSSSIPSAEAEKEEKVKKKKCVFITSEEMERDHKDEAFRLKKMYILDIRPYHVTMDKRQILASRPITLEDLHSDSMRTINWREKKIFIVGESTESAAYFCSEMIKKDYIVKDIYVLEGGIDAWTGPVSPRFNDTICGKLSYNDLVNIENSGRKVEFVDFRSRENYDGEHIKKAYRGDGINRNRLFENYRIADWLELKENNGVVVFIGENVQEASHVCRSAKRGTGLDNFYILSGNMKGWEGEVKTEHMEIWKRKIKDFFRD